MASVLRYLFPFFDASAQTWSIEARLLRWLTMLWLSLGLVMVYSASYVAAGAATGDGLYFFKGQLVWIFLGLTCFNILTHSSLRYMLGLADWGVMLFLGLILLTLVPGVGATVNGATRWLVIGPVALQPSEMIKPFLVLQSARIFGQWERLPMQARLVWLGVFTVVLGGILIQPNLSTTALCGMMIWLIALSSGMPYRYLGSAAGLGLMTAIVSVSFKSYQRRRLISFLNPWADAREDGYQLVQSLLAIGSGGFWGRGFGMSQQKLFYLPIQYTDFIFSVYAEEFGFVGCFLLFALLAIYATLAMRVAMKSQNPVHRLVAVGGMILMVGQALLNIGVATGALPTTGLPFPLVSYGGSSMLASLLTAGLLVRVARENSNASVLSLETRQMQES
ncbi:MAG: FtsW/RodA/SpoVE family cell cycle protein [Pegethrix bostrychoides GSE-TBD4-15B]|jgi:cell division protein FtsW|uniref:Probable peptidoglycan glycosyltransferase FtsW n=1 Tax=Pegethrix bostrychoides GSE-TBD4-15B TaxID=2839662 RepID=A0A951U6B9_9CYAN|nr:FtsW/RodA/SpoVE family cell cycle protein [Pegethrix bostrychoides GSE-TBD4-15B]